MSVLDLYLAPHRESIVREIDKSECKLLECQKQYGAVLLGVKRLSRQNLVDFVIYVQVGPSEATIEHTVRGENVAKVVFRLVGELLNARKVSFSTNSSLFSYKMTA